MPFDIDAKKLAALRKAAGMIQADLARAVGVNRVTVSDIERGKLRPSADLVGRIATALDVSPDDLRVPEVPTSNPEGNAADESTDEARLLEVYRSLPPVLRAKLVGFALGLAAQPDEPAGD